MSVTDQIDGAAARAAVTRTASRLGTLLRRATHRDAPALGQWDLTDVAVHVSHALGAVLAMSRGGGSLLDDISHLSTLTIRLVEGEAERDLGVLADRIEASCADLVQFLETVGEDPHRTWIVEGTELPLSSLTCHALNELLLHGRDIALAEGVPWPIERSDAALIVRGFLFPALSALGPSMVSEEADGVRASFDVRLRGGGAAVLRFDDGNLSVEAPSGPVDCHLSVDPAGFLLVAWGRTSQWHAISRGQLLAWGRRPWMALRLRSLVTNP